MNNTHPVEEIQDCPQEQNEFLIFLNDLLQKINRQMEKNIANELHELYLKLRKAVIMEFDQYKESTGGDFSELLSNVLLGMESCFQAKKGTSQQE